MSIPLLFAFIPCNLQLNPLHSYTHTSYFVIFKLHFSIYPSIHSNMWLKMKTLLLLFSFRVTFIPSTSTNPIHFITLLLFSFTLNFLFLHILPNSSTNCLNLFWISCRCHIIYKQWLISVPLSAISIHQTQASTKHFHIYFPDNTIHINITKPRRHHIHQLLAYFDRNPIIHYFSLKCMLCYSH